MIARAILGFVGVIFFVGLLTFTARHWSANDSRGAIAATSATSAAPHKESEADYRLGVFPFLPALTLDRVFAMVVEDLGAGLGRTVHFRTKSTFEQFVNALDDGTFDFVFVHPFFYVSAADNHGYLPVARLKDPLIVNVFARASLSAESLGGLRGKTLGLPPKLAAVSEIMFGELEVLGMTPGRELQVRHFQSKMSCLQAVVLGSIDACGLPGFAMAHLDLGRDEELKIIHRTKPFPSVLFAAHPRVPKQDRERLQRLILGWEKSPRGMEILEAGKWNGFAKVNDADYDPVRRLARKRHDFSQRQ
jgi:ABC-type phosphate/phosphonate transport system substrate-binding protein